MSVKKIIRHSIAASSPLVSALNRRKPSVAEITFGAQKALPGLHAALDQVDAESGNPSARQSHDNYGELSVVLDQALAGAQMVARTTPNEVMATYTIPEAQNYRDGIALFVEAYNWLERN